MSAAQPLRTIDDIHADIDALRHAQYKLLHGKAYAVSQVYEVDQKDKDIEREIFLLEIEKQFLKMGCTKSDTKE